MIIITIKEKKRKKNKTKKQRTKPKTKKTKKNKKKTKKKQKKTKKNKKKTKKNKKKTKTKKQKIHEEKKKKVRVPVHIKGRLRINSRQISNLIIHVRLSHAQPHKDSQKQNSLHFSFSSSKRKERCPTKKKRRKTKRFLTSPNTTVRLQIWMFFFFWILATFWSY